MSTESQAPIVIYQEADQAVEVRITPEELVVLSFPGPDRSIRMEALRVGRAVSRRYRNRRIGEFLKELDLTEGRSTGIPKVLRAMSANGSPLPAFDTDEDRSYFLIRLPVHDQAEKIGGKAQSGAQSGAQSDVVLQALWPGELSSRELVSVIGLKSKTGAFKRTLQELMDAGLVEYTLPDKPSSRLQKYRLTTKARKLMDEEGA